MEDRTTTPLGIDLSRLRRGEITLVVGALIVLLGLFAPPWYAATDAVLEIRGAPGGPIPSSFGAWSGAGWLATLGNLLILATALYAIAAAVSGGKGIELDGSGNWLFGMALASTAVVVLRMIFTPTSLDSYHFDAGLRLGIFVTLVGALAMAWGAWRRRLRR